LTKLPCTLLFLCPRGRRDGVSLTLLFGTTFFFFTSRAGHFFDFKVAMAPTYPYGLACPHVIFILFCHAPFPCEAPTPSLSASCSLKFVNILMRDDVGRLRHDHLGLGFLLFLRLCSAFPFLYDDAPQKKAFVRRWDRASPTATHRFSSFGFPPFPL